MIWARWLGRAAIVVAYVVAEPVGAVRAALEVMREFRRDSD